MSSYPTIDIQTTYPMINDQLDLPIYTDRLIIRALQSSDLLAYHSLLTDKEVHYDCPTGASSRDLAITGLETSRCMMNGKIGQIASCSAI